MSKSCVENITKERFLINRRPCLWYLQSHFPSFVHGGKGLSLASKKKGLNSSQKPPCSHHLPLFIVSRSIVSIFECESPSLLYTYFITMTVVAFCFFSLLFLVNCSYLNQWSSLLVLPVINSKLEQEEGGRGGTRKWCLVWERLGGDIKLGSTIPKPQPT